MTPSKKPAPVEHVDVAHVEGATHQIRIALPLSRIAVLHGENETGKSSVIDALRALLTGEGPITVSRGHQRGFVRGFDAEVRSTGARTTRSGEPSARIIHGGDPRSFVSPKGEKAETRDAERLRLLVRLSGADIPESEWIGLFGGDEQRYRELVRTETINEKDPLEKARLIKRDVEVHARQAEGRAEVERARGAGIRQTVADIDIERPHDEGALAQSLADRSATLARLEAEDRAAGERARAFANARAALDAAAAARGGQSSAAAQQALDAEIAQHDAAEVALGDATRAVQDAERVLEERRSAQRIATNAKADSLRRVEQARAAVAGAKAAETSLEQARSVVEAGAGAPGPTPEAISAARDACTAARQDVQYGERVRLALSKLRDADAAGEQATKEDRAADTLRAIASGTEGVLAAAIAKVAPKGLRIEEGRLWLRRGEVEELVDDLSDGARAGLALRIMADAAGNGGVVVLDQTYWESLGPARRAEAIAHVATLPVRVLTAECARGGELRSEVLEPSVSKVNGTAKPAAFGGDDL